MPSRVQTLLLRLVESPNDPTTVKTCCGALSILSRDDEQKVQIARDGLGLILQSMRTHSNRLDVLEPICDLLWSLAFKNSGIKKSIGIQGGVKIVITTMKRHIQAEGMIKSALGTLSNLCQVPENQSKIGQEGGIDTVLDVLRTQRRSLPILPFALDALASITVGNHKNGNIVYELGGIDLILSLLEEHRQHSSIVKSGCHVLAILSDVPGQGVAIAKSDGVKTVIRCLSMRGVLNEFQKIATVVILRMLNEADICGSLLNEMAAPILFNIIEVHENSSDTMAATAHILFEMTEYSVLNRIDLTAYFPANFTKNPSKLSHLVNMNSLENLCCAIIKHTRVKDITDCGIQLLCFIDKGSLKRYTLSGAEDTLTAFLIFFRTQPDNSRLVENVFAILSTHWKAYASSMDLSSHVCFGFIGFALIRFSRFASSHLPTLNEVKEVCAFMEEVVKIRAGCEAIVSCGGRVVIRSVRSDIEDFHGDPDLHKSLNSIFEKLTAHSSNAAVSEEIKSSESPPSTHGANKLHPKALRGTTAVGVDEDDDEDSDDGSVNDEASEASEDGVACAEVAESHCDIYKSDDDGGVDGKERIRTLCTTPETNNSIALGKGTTPSLSSSTSSSNTKAVAGNQPDTTSSDGLETRSFTLYNPRSGKQYPLHPQRNVSHPNSDVPVVQQQTRSKRLLSVSPCSIEFCASSTASPSLYEEDYHTRRTAFLTNPSAIHAKLVYANESIAGTDIKSHMEYPLPYDTTCSTSTNAVVDFHHSLTFDSAFESGNLMRVYQIGEFEYDLILRPDLHTTGFMQWFYFAISNVKNSENNNNTVDKNVNNNVNNTVKNVENADDVNDTVNNVKNVKNVNNTPSYERVKANDSVPSPPFQSQNPCSSEKGQRYRFNVINLCKPDSLFNQGLRPVLYSVKDAATKGVGWRRSAEHISYYSNPFPKACKSTGAKNSANSDNTYHTLSFYIHLENEDDTYLLAHSYPYTVTDYRTYIQTLMEAPSMKHKIHRAVLCKTLGGLECDVLTVTDHKVVENDTKQRRKVVILSSRVHPGESQASWMMQGVIQFLTSEAAIAQALRRLYVFKIVPMLNPDGVFYGNNRCGLSACDLNRQWKRPSRSFHPTVYHTKALIRNESIQNEVLLYCDIHGHSRKKNVFMYGCDTKKFPNPRVRIFPQALSISARGRPYFSFQDCSFHFNKSRESTARVVVAKDLQILYSFTLEASFCGPGFGTLAGTHFNIEQLQEIGTALCETIFDYTIPDMTLRRRVIDLIERVDDLTEFNLPSFVEDATKNSVTVDRSLTNTQVSSLPGNLHNECDNKSAST